MDFKKAQGKDTSEVLRRTDTVVKNVENSTLDGLDMINKWYAEQNQKLLEVDVDEKERLQTDIEQEEIDGIATQTETVEGIQTDINQETDDSSETETNSQNIQTLVKKNGKKGSINTATEDASSNQNTSSDGKDDVSPGQNSKKENNGKKKSFGIFTSSQGKGSKAITVGLKTAKVANKTAGTLNRKSRSIQTSINNEDVVVSSKKEVGTTIRHTTGKIVNAATRPARRAIVRNIMRLMKKLAQALVQLMNKLISALIAAGPEVLAAAAIIVILIAAISMFGVSLSDEDIKEYKEYMTSTQQEYDNITVPYYKQGKLVEGGNEGKGYINWQAGLSIIQGLGVELSYDDAEKYLLQQFKDAGLFERIENVEYTYEKEVTKIDAQGKEYTVIETFTDIKKVITNPSLSEYIAWCNQNFQVIQTFMAKKGVTYNQQQTSFSEDEMYLINNLYSSNMFFDLFGEEFSSGYGPGSIIPGGGNGQFRYPTYSLSISAGFPNYSDGSWHGGIDFPVPLGTDVCAAEAGTVKVVERLSNSYGYYIIIDHGDGLQTLYAHNSQLFVQPGEKVERGQVIAKSGSTGNSTGPHCHFEVRKDGKQVNPMDYLKEKNTQEAS